MKIANTTYAVVTQFTADIATWAAPIAEGKNRWCAIHGYPLFTNTKFIDAGRPAVWSKLVAILHAMFLFPASTWIFWTDADSIITSPARSLAAIIPSTVPDACLMQATYDTNGFNAGNFLLRNTEASRALLHEAYAQVDCIKHHWQEQEALRRCLHNRPQALCLLPKRTINSYPDDWQAGDLLCHLAGRPRTLPIVEEWIAKECTTFGSRFIP